MQASAIVRQSIAAANTQLKASPASVPVNTAPADDPADRRRAGEHDRAEAGDDECRAERAEEVHRAGRDAELMHGDRVLHHHDRERKRWPQAKPTSAIRPSAAAGESPVGASASGTNAAIESTSPASGTRL